MQSVEGDHVNCDFMEPAHIRGSNDKRTLWKWPSSTKKDNQTIHKKSVLPIRPCLNVSKYSSMRVIVFELSNCDLVDKFM